MPTFLPLPRCCWADDDDGASAVDFLEEDERGGLPMESVEFFRLNEEDRWRCRAVEAMAPATAPTANDAWLVIVDSVIVYGQRFDLCD